MSPDERTKLIDALIEGDVSEADFLRLEAELCIDPEARSEYYDRVSLSMALESMATHSEEDKVIGPTSWARSRGTAAVLGGLAAAAALVLAAWLWPQPEEARQSLAADSEELRAQGFGVLTGQFEAAWGKALTLDKGALIPTGELELTTGVAQMELFSGVTLVLEAPAKFELVSAMEMKMSSGRLRAQVPEPAHGFRVHTAEGEVVDLGTEFALNVFDGHSEVHVLDGEVEWHGKQAQDPRRLGKGEAVRASLATGLSADLPADAEAFVNAAELRKRLATTRGNRLADWESVSKQHREDPRLIAFYQTASGGDWDRRLPNLAKQGTAGEGAVVAASQTIDRWGRDRKALDFSPTGSRVRVTVPGEYRSLTFLTWVKIHSLDRWYNSLFLTDGHDQFEPHWQIMDDGRLFFSVKKHDVWDPKKGQRDKHIYFSPSFWEPSLSGQWLMLATTYDVDAKLVTHYFNGRPLSEEAIPEEYLVETVRIGNASLANWGLPESDDPQFAVRNLNGSMDEFMLFKEALSADDILTLYEHGKH